MLSNRIFPLDLHHNTSQTAFSPWSCGADSSFPFCPWALKLASPSSMNFFTSLNGGTKPFRQMGHLSLPVEIHRSIHSKWKTWQQQHASWLAQTTCSPGSYSLKQMIQVASTAGSFLSHPWGQNLNFRIVSWLFASSTSSEMSASVSTCNVLCETSVSK